MKRTLNILPLGLNLKATEIDDLIRAAETLNIAVPTMKVVFKIISEIGVEPKVFSYKIEAFDGRTWEQSLTFDNLTNPLLTFNMGSQWRLSEFSNQRTLRTLLVTLVSAYPTLEKVVYNLVEA